MGLSVHSFIGTHCENGTLPSKISTFILTHYLTQIPPGTSANMPAFIPENAPVSIPSSNPSLDRGVAFSACSISGSLPFTWDEFPSFLSTVVDNSGDEYQWKAVLQYENWKIFAGNVLPSHCPIGKRRSPLPLIRDFIVGRGQWVHTLPEIKRETDHILKLQKLRFRPSGCHAGLRVKKGAEKKCRKNPGLPD